MKVLVTRLSDQWWSYTKKDVREIVSVEGINEIAKAENRPVVIYNTTDKVRPLEDGTHYDMMVKIWDEKV